MSHCLDVENVECISDMDMEGLVPAEPSKQPSIVSTKVQWSPPPPQKRMDVLASEGGISRAKEAGGTDLTWQFDVKVWRKSIDGILGIVSWSSRFMLI